MTTATRRTIAAADLTAGMTVRIPGAGADLRVNGTAATDDPDVISVWLDGEDLSYPFGRDVAVEVIGFTEWPARTDVINRWDRTVGDRTMTGPQRALVIRGAVRANEAAARAARGPFVGVDIRTFVSDVDPMVGVAHVTTMLVAGPTTPRH